MGSNLTHSGTEETLLAAPPHVPGAVHRYGVNSVVMSFAIVGTMFLFSIPSVSK